MQIFEREVFMSVAFYSNRGTHETW